MGMYDVVVFSEKCVLSKHGAYQTKDTPDQYLTMYSIDEKGVVRSGDEWLQNLDVFADVYTSTEGGWKGTWIEYKLLIRAGVVLEVRQVSPEQGDWLPWSHFVEEAQ